MPRTAVQLPLGFVSEGNLLDGSIVNGISPVNASGQEVETLDFSDSSFNQNWEDGI